MRPALDLLARVELGAPAADVHLGCGPGNGTAPVLHRHAEVTALNSPVLVIPAKAGIHRATAGAAQERAPAFAGTTGWEKLNVEDGRPHGCARHRNGIR